MKSKQHYFIKYGSMFFFAAGLMFWLAIFQKHPVMIFIICLGIAWAVIEDDEELEKTKDKQFSRNHLKTLKKAYREDLKNHNKIPFLTFFLENSKKEKISNEDQRGKCIKCGCTDYDCRQCIERTGEPCRWVDDEHTLCSACDLPHNVLD